MSTLQTSQQATSRTAFPRNDLYPFRCIIMECDARGLWSVVSVFEMATYAAAEFEALSICTEPYAAGVSAMHFTIGEVA